MKFIFRFFYVWHILSRYGIDLMLPHKRYQWLLKPFVLLMPTSWFREEYIQEKPAARVRKCLEKLGPIYVKFGQALSTRPDLLEESFAKELAKLQDKVEPFDTTVAKEMIEKSLGESISEAFLDFDDKVLASASIAQVYTARLKTGEKVAVKILRPNIRNVIKADMFIMSLFSNIGHNLIWDLRPLRLPEVVNEFRKTTYNELDLRQEAANGSLLHEHFKDSELLKVPKIYWNYCKKDLLVSECVFGIPISDVKTLKENNVNLKYLAECGVTIFFTQVFNYSFFHADMHPGNIFVDITNPYKPKYIAVDFGIMGSLSDDDQYYLAGNFLGFFERDYRRVAQLHIDCGWVPKETSVIEFESAIRKASEPIFGKSLKDISFAQFLLTLFETGRQFNMTVQPQLILLQKTFFNIEGLGRVLYPDLDLWDTGRPFLKSWLKDAYSPKTVFTFLKNHHYEAQKTLLKIPDVIDYFANKKSKRNISITFLITMQTIIIVGILVFLLK